MSVLEAVVNVLTAWAWPAVVLVVAILLRKELAAVLRRLQELSGPAGLAAKFDREVAAVSKLAVSVAPDLPPQLETPAQLETPPQEAPGAEEPAADAPRPRPDLQRLQTTYLDELMEQARTDPAGAVLVSWQLVERVAGKARRRNEVWRASVSGTAELLAAEGLMSASLVAVAMRLQRLRNEVAHLVFDVDTRGAIDFVEAAWRLASAMELAHEGQYARSDAHEVVSSHLAKYHRPGDVLREQPKQPDST